MLNIGPQSFLQVLILLNVNKAPSFFKVILSVSLFSSYFSFCGWKT